MLRIWVVFVCLLSSFLAYSGEGYMFRLQLTDKNQTQYSLDRPIAYLSQKAIDRRIRQHIEIDETDLPLSSSYIDQLQNLGVTIVAKSKWMNTVSVYCSDSIKVEELKALDFVSDALFVWKDNPIEKKRKVPVLKKTKILNKPQSEYGYGFDQMNTVNAFELHERGYKGKGIDIAVIDAGYQNLNDILLLDNISIKGIKDFVYQGEDIFVSSDHGLKVLSIMGSNRPGTYIGTAPEASYWLFRSEDPRSEYAIEEDYWIAAAEYADSIGVDIINTSLGYYRFDFPGKGYDWQQVDGKTAFISKAAEIATQKGIFVEVSAGNEGTSEWKKIVVPSDAEHVLAVGAIAKDSIIALFSSRGYSADGRVKPDVVALGQRIHTVTSTGDIEQVNGTSFSGPVMSGLVACLWQAYPKLTNKELLNIIRRSAHKYNSPDEAFGYGIPNMKIALDLAANPSAGIGDQTDENSKIEIQKLDSLNGVLIINNMNDNPCQVLIVTVEGKIILQKRQTEREQIYYLPQMKNQIYVVNVKSDRADISKKIKL